MNLFQRLRLGRAASDEQTLAARAGKDLLALRVASGSVVPQGCTAVIFNESGQARRLPDFRAGGAAQRLSYGEKESAWCFHPGPYSADLAPFALAPEIGLRLQFVVDAPDPRVNQQRFDLFLASEAGSGPELSAQAFSAMAENALRLALAQGRLELPPCTSPEEWIAFRAGLNELLYTRFGITVEDCMPVDLGDTIDFAAILRTRAARDAASATASATATTAATATATTTTTTAAASASASAAAAAAKAIETAAAAAVPAAAGATRSAAPAAVTGTGIADTAAASASTASVAAPAMQPASDAQPAPPAPLVPLTPTSARDEAAAGEALWWQPSAPASSTEAGGGAASGTPAAGMPGWGASDHGAEPTRASAQAGQGEGNATPGAAGGQTIASASASASASLSAQASASAFGASAPDRSARDDATALRRLFLELPALGGGLRMLELPQGQGLFLVHQGLLQRLALLALDVNTMPALALAAPGQPLPAARQRRRSGYSAQAVAALDEAWGLLARLKLAAPETMPALLDDADRILANMELSLERRRAAHEAHEAPGAATVYELPRIEPSL